MAAHTIGVDIGTTGIKVVLLDTHRGIIAQHTAASPLRSPAPTHAEADARHWYRAAIAGIRAVLAHSHIDPKSVRAIASTGMVPALVLLDEHSTPIRAPILQNDARATQEIAHLVAHIDTEQLLDAAGATLSQQSIAPTALWLHTHEPAHWERTRCLVGSYDYLQIAFGAERHVEQNWAIESGLYRLDGSPYQPILEAAGIAPELLAEPVTPGTVLGTLAPTVARETGLTEHTLLVAGGADHVLSALIAGVEHPGDYLIKLGGAGDILAATRHAVRDRRLYLDAHPHPNLWLPNGCMATSGSLLRWLQQLTGGTDLVAADAEAATRSPAALICLPYFLGEKSPLHDTKLRGAYLGLTLNHTRADLHRAALEAVAFGFRHHLEVMRDVGIRFEHGCITNGGSNSALWQQIHADVLGLPLTPVRGHPGASLGAAILAAIGAKELSYDEVQRFVTFAEPYLPDPEAHHTYTEAYALWRDAGDALTPVSHRIAARQTGAPAAVP